MAEDTTLETDDSKAADESATAFRPAVAGSTSRSSQQTPAEPVNQKTDSAKGDNTTTSLEELGQSIGLQAKKQSPKVTKLLEQIASLSASASRTAIQNKLLTSLRKSVKAQDKADSEAEEVAYLTNALAKEERATASAELIQLADTIADAQGVDLSEALGLIKKAVGPLLKA